jgi:hypothetical protein
MPFKTTAAHGNTFLQAWIGLWRKYSSTPFVSAGRMQKKPALNKGIKNLMRILDRSLAKAATYLRKFDDPTYNRMDVAIGTSPNLPSPTSTNTEPQRHTRHGSLRIQTVPAPRPSA